MLLATYKLIPDRSRLTCYIIGHLRRFKPCDLCVKNIRNIQCISRNPTMSHDVTVV